MFNWIKSLFGKADSTPSIGAALKYFRRGDYATALEHAERILALDSNIALSWRFKAECLEELERYSEALDDFRKAFDLGGPGTEDLPNRIAMMEFCTGQKDAAMATLKSVLESDADAEIKQQAQEMVAEFSKY